LWFGRTIHDVDFKMNDSIISSHPVPTAANSAANNSSNNNKSHSSPDSSRLGYYEEVSNFWHSIDLAGLKSRLDGEALLMSSEEEKSVAARKNLSELTRKLKNSAESDQLKQLGTVMKSYQEEINHLTKRSKYAENCYLVLYKLLLDAVDPAPVLGELINLYPQYLDQSHEISKLQGDLAAYDKEFKSLTNQDYKIKKLEREVQELNNKYNGKCEELLSNNSEELNNIISELKQRLNDTEASYEHKIAAMKSNYNQLLLSNTATQSALFEHNSVAEMSDKQKELEVELIQQQLDNANQTIAQLKLQLDTNNNSKTSSNYKNSNDLQQYENEINSLRSQLEFSEEKSRLHLSELNEQLASVTTNFSTASAQFSAANAEISQLKATIKQLPSVEEYSRLKKSLQEFQMKNADSATLINQSTAQFEGEITQLKLQLHEKNEQIKALQIELNSEKSLLEEFKQITAKMEQDLELANQSTDLHSTRNSSGSNSADFPAMVPHSPADLAQNPLFSILTGQRDRYKLKFELLEKQKIDLQSKFDTTLIECNRLRDDNLKLYEKLQFVRNYTKNHDNSKDLEGAISSMNAADSTESNYAALYEERTNPFKEFAATRVKEREKNLPTSDKLTLKVARLLFSKRIGRSFVFFYSLILHLLIMVVLWTHTFQDHCTNPDQQDHR
jgi:homeobox protein cut-like